MIDYKKSLEDLYIILNELEEINKKIPIIVEGNKDINALRKINITGEIISVNKGMSIADFCDYLSYRYKEIVILTDLDRKGGQLCYKIKKNLIGRVDCNTNFRKKIPQKTIIRTIEGLPSWITTMNEKFNHL